MSAAGVSLGTLLIQRLDAMLGTTLAQQSNLASGARTDAVSQPAQADRNKPADHKAQRHPQGHREPFTRRTGQVAAGRTPLAQRQAGDRPAPTHAATRTTSTHIQLGATARIILDLLAQYPQRMPVQTKEPLLHLRPGEIEAGHATQTRPHPPTRATAQTTQAGATTYTDQALATLLRHVLHRTVQDSGMFYESHLAQLVSGQRSAASLRVQPQAQLHAEADPQVVAPEAQALVRQQLEVLANQTFAWQGQAWPGTTMYWDIQRHPPAQYHSQPASAQPQSSEALEQWSTHLGLDLPNLGRVDARVMLAGRTLAVHIQAPSSASQLQRHAHALRQRMRAAGLDLVQLSIRACVADEQPSAAPASSATVR